MGLVEEEAVFVFWGVGGGSEGVEGEEVGSDDGEEHQNVDGGGAEGGAAESGGAVADLQRDGAHLGSESLDFGVNWREMEGNREWSQVGGGD